MPTVTEKNTATLVNLSTLTQYFIPLGNYFFPILIWAFRKEKSDFVDYNGKQTLNFQLSMLLYSLLLAAIAIPSFLLAFFNNITFDQLEAGNVEFEQIFSGNNTGLLAIAVTALVVFCTLKVVEFFLVIYAAVKTSNGENYRYPMSISFLR